MSRAANRRAPGEVYSFDVFDTVLSRTYAEPDDLHLHLGEVAVRQGWVDDADALVQARRQAETRAWLDNGHRGAIRIETIHLCMAEALGWPAERALATMQLEVDLEQACVRALPAAQARLAELRRARARLCFISDMHLHGSQVRDLLLQLALAHPDDPVFVSSDLGASKRSGGRLYRHVLLALDIAPWRLRHCGDDLRADVHMARLRGVRANHMPEARLNRYELATLAHLPAPDWRARSVVSASRFARLGPLADSWSTDAARSSLLCSTIAPLVTGYALWLIEQAQARGITDLFFMARDMQIVHEVASTLVQARGLALRCVYIHASRAAWQPAGYGADPDFDLFWLCDQPEHTDPIEALARLLEADRLHTLRAAGELEPVAGESRTQTVQRWLRQPAVAQAAAESAGKRRTLLLSYLAQLGYRPDDKCALVDAGWRGTLQKCLENAYRAHDGECCATNPAAIHAFYIGLRHRVAVEPGSSMTSYLPDAAVTRHGYSLVALIEGFLCADHGSTRSYGADQDGQVLAVLGPRPPADMIGQWQAVRAACLAHTGEYIRLPAFASDARPIAGALLQPLLLLCAEPTPKDASILGRWYIDVGRSTPQLKPLTGKLTLKDGVKLLLAWWRRTPEGDVYLSGPWLRGALAASLPIVAGPWRLIFQDPPPNASS